jgi:Tfp pilus assembly protein PilF
VQYFQASIDRGYAPAYAGLADAYHLLGVYDFMPHAEARRRAMAAAAKGIELDDSLAEAYISLGYIHSEQLEWTPAEASFQRGLELRPAYATGHHWYAIYLVRRGRSSDALAEIQKALALDPFSISVNGQLGALLLYAHRYDDAIGQLEKTLRMDPMFARAHMILSETYAQKGDYDLALAEATKALELGGGGAELQADVGYVHAVAGRRQPALEIVHALEARYRRAEDGAAGAIAVIYAGLNDADQTLLWLDRGRALFDPMIPDLGVDPRFDSVRRDPRFAKLLATVGLAQ